MFRPLFVYAFSLFRIHEYEEIWQSLPTLAQQWKKILLPSYWVYSPGVSRAIFTLTPPEKRLTKPSPIIFMKAEKNQREIEGMEKASIRDSAALIDFLSFFEEQVSNIFILFCWYIF